MILVLFKYSAMIHFDVMSTMILGLTNKHRRSINCFRVLTCTCVRRSTYFSMATHRDRHLCVLAHSLPVSRLPYACSPSRFPFGTHWRWILGETLPPPKGASFIFALSAHGSAMGRREAAARVIRCVGGVSLYVAKP